MPVLTILIQKYLQLIAGDYTNKTDKTNKKYVKMIMIAMVIIIIMIVSITIKWIVYIWIGIMNTYTVYGHGYMDSVLHRSCNYQENGWRLNTLNAWFCANIGYVILQTISIINRNCFAWSLWYLWSMLLLQTEPHSSLFLFNSWIFSVENHNKHKSVCYLVIASI